jgi:TPR repeat protein
MRHLTVSILIIFAVLLGSAGEGMSADFQRELDAYSEKDYTTAFREWEPLAEQVDPSAQVQLGLMHGYRECQSGHG